MERRCSNYVLMVILKEKTKEAAFPSTLDRHTASCGRLRVMLSSHDSRSCGPATTAPSLRSVPGHGACKAVGRALPRLPVPFPGLDISSGFGGGP